jgi:hypothetical protein
LENKIVCWGESIIAGVENKSFWFLFYTVYAFGYNTLSIRLLNHGHMLQVIKSQGAFCVWNTIFKTMGVLKFDFGWSGFGGIMCNSDCILEFA